MGFLRVLSLLLFVKCVFSEESLLKPCAVEDMDCLRKSTETFLEGTSAGIPAYDIKPIDPLFISMVCVEGSKGVMLHFKNVTITGLKKLKIEDFKMDTKEKLVVLSTKHDLDIVADLVVELTDVKKTFTGTYTAKTSTIGTAKYSYEIKPDDKNVQHFEIGPETITCQALTEPDVTLNSELQEALKNDPDTQSKKDEYYSGKEQYRKAAVCKIVEEALVTIVHNIRASAKVMPVEAFFTNVPIPTPAN